MNLNLAAIIIHGAVIVLCGFYAFLLRHSPDRRYAFALAGIWTLLFIIDRANTALVGMVPSIEVEPVLSSTSRIIQELESALYLLWPAGVFAWIGWMFGRIPLWPTALAWLFLSLLPALNFPYIKGSGWFPLAGSVHLIAFLIELSIIIAWIRLRERPRAWHTAGMVAAIMTVFPAIPFLVSSEARAGYLQWVLRGLVAGHLAILAIVGGELWTRSSGPSPS